MENLCVNCVGFLDIDVV